MAAPPSDQMMRAVSLEYINTTRHPFQHKSKPLLKRIPFVRSAFPAAIVCPRTLTEYSSFLINFSALSVTRSQACLGCYCFRVDESKDPEFDGVRMGWNICLHRL